LSRPGDSLLPVAILAGGLATRMRPITEKIPKSMLDVGGEPFISQQLKLLRAKGVRRAVLCVGFLGEMIREFVGDGSRFDVQVDYSFDGTELRGTAGAIRNALRLLGDKFFVMYGDSYLDCDFAAVQHAFEVYSGAKALMTVFKNNGLWDRSNVEFKNGRILRYDKRDPTPNMRFIDYGLGIFAAELFDGIGSAGTFDLADVYMRALKDQVLAGFEVDRRFYEIGSPEGLRETDQLLRKNRETKDRGFP
jgi:MurNAc alpha-1-phosphate uridylyltransferase